MRFDIDLFESSSHDNGVRYWYAHDFMEFLGYGNWNTFKNIINKAMSSCARLGVDIIEAFVPAEIIINEKPVQTYKLSRFACFLITMQADSKKIEVEKAKLALAAIAEALIVQNIEDNSLVRIETREDLKAGEKLLASAAKDAGLDEKYYGLFKDAGYRGMYNMGLQQLKEYKGMGNIKETLYDYMGLTELAGNLFRVTQTSERIKNKKISGTEELKKTAKKVGQEVREMMIKNGGHKPEDLPLESNISSVKKKLKDAHKKMKKMDGIEQKNK